MGRCARCQTEATRVLRGRHQSAAGAARIECAGCGRFVGWDDGNTSDPVRTENATEATRDVAPATLGVAATAASVWPYLTRRLDLTWLPNVPFWGEPVILFTPVPNPPSAPNPPPVVYYRLTPSLLAWLERAGEQLETAGDIVQAAEFVLLMVPIWEFAATHLPPAELAAARRGPTPVLPEPPAAAVREAMAAYHERQRSGQSKRVVSSRLPMG